MPIRFKEVIKYLEKPVTSEEREVAALLSKMVEAVNTKDLRLLESLYMDETIFISGAKTLTKAEYMELVPQLIQSVRHISLEEVLIKINRDKATVYYKKYVTLKDSLLPNKITCHRLCCVERGLHWFILEAEKVA